MVYKVLIVDDEEPARDLLVSYVEKLPQLQLIDQVDNALTARTIIQQNEVDILLSDIQMEDLSGIDLIKMLRKSPATIFTTAYSEYALEGFELDIVDYLVKPISFNRFCKAIDKAIELIQYQNLPFNKSGDLMAPTVNFSNNELADFFFVKTNRKLVKVDYREIRFVESYGEYVKIHTDEDVVLALQKMGAMEQLLPAKYFIRIHRSHIVNISHIKEIDGHTVVLENHRLTVSKRMKEAFINRINDKGII